MQNYKEHMAIINLFDEQRPSNGTTAPASNNDARYVR